MPRKPRLHSPGGLYHDILRGKNRQDNLNDDVDRLELGSFVATGMEAKSIKSTPAPFTLLRPLFMLPVAVPSYCSAPEIWAPE